MLLSVLRHCICDTIAFGYTCVRQVVQFWNARNVQALHQTTPIYITHHYAIPAWGVVGGRKVVPDHWIMSCEVPGLWYLNICTSHSHSFHLVYLNVFTQFWGFPMSSASSIPAPPGQMIVCFDRKYDAFVLAIRHWHSNCHKCTVTEHNYIQLLLHLRFITCVFVLKTFAAAVCTVVGSEYIPSIPICFYSTSLVKPALSGNGEYIVIS